MKGHELEAEYIWQQPSIYFFEAIGQSLMKIGYSIDPIKRFRQIQTSCPFPIRAVLIQPGTIQRERKIHSELSHLRTHGEWFAASDETMDALTKMRAQSWVLWHDFVRNITAVRPCPRREISYGEFEALTQYEAELGNPLDKTLI